MPSGLSKWLVSCYDDNRSEIIVRGRGSIPVDEDSVHRMFGLPNDGYRVNYEVNQEATDFIIAEYGLEAGTTDITSWCKIIKDMNGASDDKFLRAWLIVAISTFLCPTTSLSASPKCYPAVMHLANVPVSN